MCRELAHLSTQAEATAARLYAEVQWTAASDAVRNRAIATAEALRVEFGLGLTGLPDLAD